MLAGRAPPGNVERGLTTLARLVSEAPWTATAGDLEAARGAGLSDDAILQTVALSAFFNYLNRVADAIDLDFDYQSALPRISRDPAREPLARPPPARWPRAHALGLRLAARAKTAEAYGRWRSYVMEREAPLSRRDRRVLARAVAQTLCDAATCEALADASPRGARESALAAYAEKLSLTPWRLAREDLQGLTTLGLSDEGVLDVISVSAHQTTASRLSLLIDVA